MNLTAKPVDDVLVAEGACEVEKLEGPPVTRRGCGRWANHSKRNSESRGGCEQCIQIHRLGFKPYRQR